MCGNAIRAALRRVLHPPSPEDARSVHDLHVLELSMKHTSKANTSITKLRAISNGKILV